MVSGIGGISGAGRGGRKSKPYRKHRPLPALIVIGLLGAVSVFVWLNVIVSRDDLNEAVRCTPPPSPPEGVTYTSLGYDGLDGVAPVPPDKVAVQVLNASEIRNGATLTTLALKDLGFSETGEPANDPAYQDDEANCRGQIRFGENGTAAARTLSLVEPCAELVKDNRKDATVDFSIGTVFNGVRPRKEGLQVLDQLSKWSASQSEKGGGEQAATPGSQIDPELISAARDVHC
ncbi:LytR cell envelope-related transcriptional attenuator [Amycolatopsis marina]|uniref:LytR cell envelope-related transcriptional attenuator n=1 Tax=Amycolatopsis marina TaxID=490629 RepID=A0A1I1B575_9PSEU|nr:envelope integrity protein Cei [Amycolatopsis marina]SFB45514.1 LytR cell envelope-related transcriptional attenuator [Amycolatopsis marina]